MEESSGGEATTTVQNVGRDVTRSMEYTRWSWMVAMHTGGDRIIIADNNRARPQVYAKENG